MERSASNPVMYLFNSMFYLEINGSFIVFLSNNVKSHFF